jgi:hypothetical protein
MHFSRLLPIILLTCVVPASAQIREQTNSSAIPAPNDDAGQSPVHKQGEPWRIIPDSSTSRGAIRFKNDAGSVPYPKTAPGEGFRLFLNTPAWPKPTVVVRPDGQSATIVLPGGEYVGDPICYSIRSYLVARDEKDSDSTHPVGSSTCQPARRYGVKNAQTNPGSADH